MRKNKTGRNTKKARRGPKRLRIAVCGRNPLNAARIWQLITDCGIDADICVFSSPDALLYNFRRGLYGYIFCDADTARLVRGRDAAVIIAVTAEDIKKARQETAGLNILKYIENTPTADDILDANALYGVQRCNKWQIVISTGSAGILPASARRGFIKVPVDTIYRAEERGRGCAVYTTCGIFRTGRAFDFNTLTETLSVYGFTLCEGGVLINPRYAYLMDESEIPPQIVRITPGVYPIPGISVGARFIAPATVAYPAYAGAAACRPRFAGTQPSGLAIPSRAPPVRYNL